MKEIFDKIKKKYYILKNFNFIRNKKIKFLFYSENKSYQKYTYSLIKTLSQKKAGKVYYISSDADDSINNLNVINLYIGKGIIRQIFFLIVKAENIFLTLTDLNNHFVKKTNNIQNYIYYFHSPVSTTKVYTKGAFDHYDTILCNGPYQINEIRHRENLKNINRKKLIKSGYFYFDYLKDNINLKKKCDEILIAPSWNYNEPHFIDENFEIIISFLLEKNFKIRFRPHPEHFIRSKIILDRIKKNLDNDKFIFDTETENKVSMENAKCLITDNSGIAIEYSLIFKKPVLYLTGKEKLHNVELNDYKNFVNLEDNIKELFGYKFKVTDIQSLDQLIDNSVFDFAKKDFEIDKFIDTNFFNYNRTTTFFNNNIDDILYK
jgi:YidC/Oxa1 family membrane protein insertase